MIEAGKKAQNSIDILEQEYHDIAIHAVQAATCIKRHEEDVKHDDYGDVIEDTGE